MHKDPKIEVLRSFPALAHYPDKALSRLSPLFDICDFAEGDTLTVEGAVARQMFLVVEGEAVVLRDGEQIAGIGPGEFIGEMGMLDHQPRSATVVAATPMQVLVVSPNNFATVLEAPALLRRMASDLATRLRTAP